MPATSFTPSHSPSFRSSISEYFFHSLRGCSIANCGLCKTRGTCDRVYNLLRTGKESPSFLFLSHSLVVRANYARLSVRGTLRTTNQPTEQPTTHPPPTQSAQTSCEWPVPCGYCGASDTELKSEFVIYVHSCAVKCARKEDLSYSSHTKCMCGCVLKVEEEDDTV